MSRTPDQLSTSTLFYLFAREWLPAEANARLVAVPGGWVNERVAYANLVGVAVWTLVRHEMVRVTPLREVRAEPLTFLGGSSFCRLEQTGAGTGAVAGLESLLLHHVETAERAEDNDLRRLLHRLPRSKYPWPSVAGAPFTELVEAGLVRRTGWVVKRVRIVDEAGIEQVRPRFEERRRLRADDLARGDVPYDAVVADGMEAFQWLSMRGD
jgi:hypothetical protein